MQLHIVKNIVHNNSKLKLPNMIEKWKGFLNKGNNIVPFFMDHSKAFQTQVTPYYWLS